METTTQKTRATTITLALCGVAAIITAAFPDSEQTNFGDSD